MVCDKISIKICRKDIHENIQWGLYAFMLFHIVGVVMADNAKYGGIVSRMINGNKEL